MMDDSRAAAAPSVQLSPEESASCDALIRQIGRGSMMTVVPVRQAEIGNRILEAMRGLLQDQGFLVVVVDGGSDNAVEAAWSLTAVARREARKSDALGPTVLIVKDAHLLPPEKLELLRDAGDLAIVTAPVAMGGAQGKVRRPLPRVKIATILAVPVFAIAALGVSVWSSTERGAPKAAVIESASIGGALAAWVAIVPSTETAAAVAPAGEPAPAIPEGAPKEADAGGAPGLLLKARDGDTLQTLYGRVYRGATPPPFESVAALNPEPVESGAILAFPEPENGWAGWGRTDAGSGVR